ncbi:hypothetical protein DVQ84_01560 [Yersinia enterocolitica]|nr:hypothetical protein [Yersinia enterocolitica]QBP97728.1 hypothetical protein YEY1_02175 [Yersinia enterocolitica subsp. palearctica]EKN4925152.1 hypothetical protein [Yersinia enterocolitica]EKN4929142.1 hypothetical protein [Yersinia enterocolitica]EKN5011564.1 hypothetical protein [Yersinia enterocolitica]
MTNNGLLIVGRLWSPAFIPVILQAACALATFNHPNHLQHRKLIGILSLATFLQLELFRVSV